jgi:hypothetical protein
MLILDIPETELFNESDGTFETKDAVTLRLEHSLLSMSKWESKWQKPFLSKNDKSREEIDYYIECMILDSNFPPGVSSRFSSEHYMAVNQYIDSPESATTFGQMPERKGRGEIITAELIYYWMVAFQIPFTCETWHLNRLFALVKICNIKNGKGDKRAKGEVARDYREMNEKRKAELGTKG